MKKEIEPAVYIITNKRNGTLYTGVTSDLVSRIYDHKHKKFKGFSAKYGCDKLVFYEFYPNMKSAIEREKQIKAGSRAKKLKLIEDQNRDWRDLYPDILWQ